MTVGSPQPLSFRPERSGVEKSRSEMVQPPWRQEISRLRVLIEPKTFTLIPACRPARNDSRGGQHLCHSVSSSNACTQPAASVISTGAGQPPIRPERSEVEKSRSEMVQPPWRQEISRLRVLIEPKTFTLIPACRPARNDSSRDAAPASFCFFLKCLYTARRPCHFDRSRSAANRKALLNFSFPLEGNAAKRQRVYEGKHTSNTLLLIYAGPTSADLETLCRVSTEWRNLTPK
jgi:hypothetical protein